MNEEINGSMGRTTGKIGETPVDLLIMPNSAELREICELTIKLTELRQNECKWLSIENFAPEIFGKLLTKFAEHKKHPTVNFRDFAMGITPNRTSCYLWAKFDQTGIKPSDCTTIKPEDSGNWIKYALVKA